MIGLIDFMNLPTSEKVETLLGIDPNIVQELIDDSNDSRIATTPALNAILTYVTEKALEMANDDIRVVLTTNLSDNNQLGSIFVENPKKLTIMINGTGFSMWLPSSVIDVLMQRSIPAGTLDEYLRTTYSDAFSVEQLRTAFALLTTFSEFNTLLGFFHSSNLCAELEAIFAGSTPTSTPETPLSIRTVNPATEDDSTARFRGAPWFDELKNVTVSILGVGGIGSWASLFIARLRPGFISLVDDDHIEEVNMSGQFYSKFSIGTPKVDAIRSNLINFCDCYAHSYRMRITEASELPHNQITVCGFDNMETRKTCFYKWIELLGRINADERHKLLFIDGRLTATELQIFAIRGDDTVSQNEYNRKWLFDDSDAEETLCSFRQTSHLAGIIGGLITNILVNHITNYITGVEMCEVPFKTEFSAATMSLKLE